MVASYFPNKLIIISFKCVIAMTFLTTNASMAQKADPKCSIFLEMRWHVSFRNGFALSGSLYMQRDVILRYLYLRTPDVNF